MQLVKYDVPEMRLYPNLLGDIKKIYNTINNNNKEEKEKDFHADDLATILGLSSDGGALYRRINSLINYGLIEGRGKFRITKLGKDIIHPVNDNQRKQLYKQAILKVPLWKELYIPYDRKPPESLWSALKEITGAKASEARKVEKEVRKWYLDDVELISYDLVDTDSFATVTVTGIGSVVVNDEKTLATAESFLNVLRKEVMSAAKEKKINNGQVSTTVSSNTQKT